MITSAHTPCGDRPLPRLSGKFICLVETVQGKENLQKRMIYKWCLKVMLSKDFEEGDNKQ